MKHVFAIAPLIVATPAFAHHEVVLATSMVPLAMAFSVIPVALFTAWRKSRKK